MKNVILTILTSVFVVLIASFLFPNKLNVNNDYSFVGGVIRNEGNGWSLINDTDHEPLDIRKVETTKESVIVYYSKAEKVISFNVTPDETMASEGYTMGASVGLDKTVISIFDKNHKLINPNDYVNERGNIWLNGIFKK